MSENTTVAPAAEDLRRYLKDEPFGCGNLACPGCGEPIALREVLNAPNGLAAIRSVLRYIAIAARPVDRDQFEETVRLFAATTEDEMQTLYDVYVEESLERGRREGLESGRREVLLRLLRKRFGDLPERATERIAKAGIVQLDTWADNVLTASTLDGVFEGS